MTFLLRASFTFFSLSVAFLFGIYFYCTHHQIVDFSELERYSAVQPTLVLDDQGQEWARFHLDRREPIKLTQMPSHLINAFLAAEDRTFFNHAGISFKGIIRSIAVNLYRRRKVQGASTITQQLVRLLFFNPQKTFSRKLKEQLLAVVVEQQFTKEQILQAYLNHVYFGCGIYGVEAASQRFWGKKTAELSVAQAALLAGIVRSPGLYCPLIVPDNAQKRRNLILYLMHSTGAIDTQTFVQARAEPLMLKPAEKQLAPHLKETLRIFLEEELGKDLVYTGGLIIQTTINKKMQYEAEQSFYIHCSKLKNEIAAEVDGALISIDTHTGEIKALVGGYNYGASKFNRALQARRQMGSVFKPLIYATAVEKGLSFASTDIDEPYELNFGGQPWKPKNFYDDFRGKMTLAQALSQSCNIIAIKTLLNVGIEQVIELAKKCRIQGPFYPYPSLALGCIDTNLKEVVGMFNIFANDGVYVEPHYIAYVKDSWGKKIYKSALLKERVLPATTCGQVTKALSLGMERARNRGEQPWIETAAIGKTGTTNDSRTCWFAGATPSVCTALYIGCDDNRSMGEQVFPVKTAFPIWLSYNRALPSGKPTFTYDPSLQEVTINAHTGKACSKKKADAIDILV